MSKQIVYILDKKLSEECSRIPNLKDRGYLVNSLVQAYGLLKSMKISSATPATREELTSFHSSSYIDFLYEVDACSDLEKYDDDQLEFGLGYDCPLFENIYNFISLIAGGSLTAAKFLIKGKAKIAINWCGGWHHAQRGEANGFCYVNDIVIAIHKLRENFDQILYIDLDIHHGNGVENAFSYSKKVMTLSFHKYECGFYPCTGSLEDIGYGNGKYYSINVPLQDGITDDQYYWLFESILNLTLSSFPADAIVVQCGADCITGDPIGTFNLTPRGLGKCVQKVLSYNLPTLFLGGGGYNITNTAKCWVYLTSVIVGTKLSSDIPDHEFFPRYGPCFDLDILPGLRKNKNTQSTLNDILENISRNLRHLS